jgi:DNA-binding NarL/FixJ family response regulator
VERPGIEVNVVRIFLADDNAMIRAYLRATLEEHAEWVVVGEAENGRRAVEACLKQAPNLAVMDLCMPVMDGLEAARQLRRQRPDVPILMITVDPSRQLEKEAKKAGIRGICSKSQIHCLWTAIEALLKGETYFPVDSTAV